MSTLYNRKIQAIVIHHMGDGQSSDVSILNRWNPHGYQFPEYDFGVEADGTIRQGRPLNYQGSHCISDKPPYSQRGDQWWNQNSIGIGIAGDFTKFPMPQAQFNGLVGLVINLMNQYKLTLDEVSPHGKVAYTDCPGCVYDKVTALHGYWNYNDFENAVKNNNQGGNDVLDVAVLLFSKEDYWAGYDVAVKNGNCALFTRLNGTIPKDSMSAKHLIVVGGSSVNHPNETLLSGNTKYDTAQKVGEYLSGK